MEVFFHGLQPGCSEKRLLAYLTVVFSEFNITREEFTCEKKKSTRVASATILDAEKAELFLQRYGRRRGALNLDGPFACDISKNVVDEYKLKSLKKKLKDSAKKISKPKEIPENKTFWAESIVCGVWDQSSAHLQFSPQYHIQCPTHVLWGKKELTLNQPVATDGSTVRQMIVRYSTIESITISVQQPNTLTLTLDRAPRFYNPPPPRDLHMELMMQQLGLEPDRNPREEPKKVRTQALDPHHARLVESCLVYQITLVPTHLQMVKKLLRKDKRLPDIINWHFIKRSHPQSFFGAMQRLHNILASSALPFAIKFQLQRLAQNSFLLPQVVEKLVPVMNGVEQKIGMEKSVQYLLQLARHLPFAGPDADGHLFDFDYLKEYLETPIEDTEEDELSAFELVRRHPHLVLVHRARVTPAGIYLHGPYAEAKNGVLERYRDHALDYFLRVSFEDENGEQLKYEPQVDLGWIHHQRFKSVLDTAIHIAGRKFKFLGFSHSSLRESSCWFLAPFIHDASPMFSQRMISELGDFSHIRSPAKCGARIGQAFTDLNDNVFIPRSAIRRVPDVERNGRCFSDGCSTASLEVFEKLWSHLRPNSFKPTTFQIRYGGVKGIISLDCSLKGLIMNIRPSQEKFPSSTEMLGICGAAKRTLPLYLNRPMIKILEDLGIGKETFLEFQNTAIQNLRLMTSSATNAATFAEIHEIGRAANLPWLLKELHYLGIDALEDHFLWSAVELIVILRLREMKYKGRIPIHAEGGATLFGIMDETNTLKPGEIYCTVNEGEVITGAVAVSRSPAMHPGDIQPAIAVDVPKDHPLKDLHNVVVFSQQGSRDLPSMLSGGDLDGDLFVIITDKKLIPSTYYAAAEYPRAAPIDLGRPVEARDISNFFVDFMSSDQLGQISTRHLQLADQVPSGVTDERCIALAGMHSVAVDFSKTGIPVDMRRILRTPSQCKPDFMANGPRILIEGGITKLDINPDTGFYQDGEDDIIDELDGFTHKTHFYESNKALGHLYRSIDESQFLDELQTGKRKGTVESENSLTKLWTHIQHKIQVFQYDHLKPWARNIRDQYNNQIADMMYQYALDPHNPLTELEVFLGIVMGKDGGVPSKRARDAASSIREQFNDVVHYTVECMLKGEEGKFGEEALERTLACFAVALEDDGEVDKKIGKLRSFGYLSGTTCLRQVQRAAVDGF